MIARAAEGPQALRPPSPSRAGLFQVELLDGIDSLRSLQSEWRRLAEATAGDNPFLSWEWAFTWAEEMMGDRLVTAVVREGDDVVAIAPFYRNLYSLGPGLKARCLQLYGPRELQTVFELRQIPMLPGREAAILRSLLAGLLESARWDWVELADYGPRTGCWREVLATLPADLRLVVQDVVQVPILPLLSTWEDQRSALRRNVKERIRRGYNSLKRDGLGFSVVIDADAANSNARVAEFHQLHERRAEVQDRKAHVDSFRHPRVRAFLSAASRRLMEAGILSYAGLEVSGSVVATRMVMQRNDSLYLYYSGFDPAWWSHSVMTVLVTEVVKMAIARHLEGINFSPGLDQFKSGWTEPDANLTSVAYMIGRQTRSSRFRLAAFRRRKRLSAMALRRLQWIRGRIATKAAEG